MYLLFLQILDLVKCLSFLAICEAAAGTGTAVAAAKSVNRVVFATNFEVN